MTLGQSRSPGAGPKHRWSRYVDQASMARANLWISVVVAVATVAGVVVAAVALGSADPAPPDRQAGSSTNTTTSSAPAPEPSGSRAGAAAPPSLPPGSSLPVKAGPLKGIPRDFLGYDAVAKIRPCPDSAGCWTEWGTSTFTKTIDLSLVKCPPFNINEVPYAEARALQRADSAADFYFEMLIRYASKEDAAKVMSNLRKSLDDCPPLPDRNAPDQVFRLRYTPRSLGDASMHASVQTYNAANSPVAGGYRSQVTQRGSVIVVYTDVRKAFASEPETADFAIVEKDTKAILPALCRFDPVC